jgi:hypothetical protein
MVKMMIVKAGRTKGFWITACGIVTQNIAHGGFALSDGPVKVILKPDMVVIVDSDGSAKPTYATSKVYSDSEWEKAWNSFLGEFSCEELPFVIRPRDDLKHFRLHSAHTRRIPALMEKDVKLG